MAKYIDYKLDQNGDIVVKDNAFVFVEDAEVIKQQIETNLMLVAGDWFLDLSEGIGYFDTNEPVFGASSLAITREAEIKNAITRVQGVSQILEFEAEVTRNSSLDIKVLVLSEFGEVPITSEVGF
jgi:hypothetical protein